MEGMTKETVAYVNKVLENDSPDYLVKVLEVFVSTLRDKPDTKPVDVELFFLDFDKLYAKMGRMESTDCSHKLVDENLKTIREHEKSFGAQLGEFSVFLDWTTDFLEAAQIDLKMVRLLDEQKELELSLQRAQLKLSRFDQMELHNRQFAFETYFQTTIQSLEERAGLFSSIVETDKAQA